MEWGAEGGEVLVVGCPGMERKKEDAGDGVMTDDRVEVGEEEGYPCDTIAGKELMEEGESVEDGGGE